VQSNRRWGTGTPARVVPVVQSTSPNSDPTNTTWLIPNSTDPVSSGACSAVGLFRDAAGNIEAFQVSITIQGSTAAAATTLTFTTTTRGIRTNRKANESTGFRGPFERQI
jgi:hypothetical protein